MTDVNSTLLNHTHPSSDSFPLHLWTTDKNIICFWSILIVSMICCGCAMELYFRNRKGKSPLLYSNLDASEGEPRHLKKITDNDETQEDRQPEPLIEGDEGTFIIGDQHQTTTFQLKECKAKLLNEPSSSPV